MSEYKIKEGSVPVATTGFVQVAEDLDPLKNLKLINFMDPRLTTPPPEFVFGAGQTVAPQTLVDSMYEHMLKWKGVGLSANQVGLPYRVFVFGDADTRNYIFNPKVLGVSKETSLYTEGCLSFPGFQLSLRRPANVTAAFQSVTGEEQVQTFGGIAARVFLHEYDHMEGINFTTHASRFKLQHELKRYKKHIKKDMLRRYGIIK